MVRIATESTEDTEKRDSGKAMHLFKRIVAGGSLAAGLLTLSGGLALAGLASGSWPMQRGSPAGEAAGVSAGASEGFLDWGFRGRPTEVYQEGIPVWVSPAFAVVEGRPCVFIGGSDQTLHALDVSARRRLWSKITNGSS